MTSTYPLDNDRLRKGRTNIEWGADAVAVIVETMAADPRGAVVAVSIGTTSRISSATIGTSNNTEPMSPLGWIGCVTA